MLFRLDMLSDEFCLLILSSVFVCVSVCVCTWGGGVWCVGVWWCVGGGVCDGGRNASRKHKTSGVARVTTDTHVPQTHTHTHTHTHTNTNSAHSCAYQRATHTQTNTKCSRAHTHTNITPSQTSEQ